MIGHRYCSYCREITESVTPPSNWGPGWVCSKCEPEKFHFLKMNSSLIREPNSFFKLSKRPKKI